MKIEKLEDFKPNKKYISKYTKMNNIIEIVSLSHKNSSCSIKKLNKEEYENKNIKLGSVSNKTPKMYYSTLLF